MKNSLLILLILLTALLGAAGLFYLESRLPDNDLSNRDINAQLLKVDNIASSINELSLRSRANLDTNYDMLVRNTVSMEQAISDLSDTYFHPDKIAGSLLETRFNSFKDAMVAKLEQVENFKSNNSVLRNSERYAPQVGSLLAETAARNQLNEVSNLYKDVVINLLAFTKQGSTKPEIEVSGYFEEIMATDSVMPEESETNIIEFANHVKTAISSRKGADQYLSAVLNSSANHQIEDIFSAWGVWQADNNSVQEVLLYYTIAYVMAMLALIGLLIFRLRSLYQNLDAEVELKTIEVKRAYKGLRETETQLAQSEKMASLGQVVAGVAHEINTPMGYVTTNVDTVQRRLRELSPIFNTVEQLSTVFADPNRSKTALSDVLKQQISAFRKLNKNVDLNNIDVLLDDTKEGLDEMHETVKSLTNFSHIQDTPHQNVDINERIEQAIKVCRPNLKDRKVVTQYGPDLLMIDGAPNQLSQVFVNIINNAIHATDNETGVITIESLQKDDNAIITVHDNGVGIDEETLKRVLDPFFTTRDVGEGTGLGLSIAHRIADAHNGTLTINSLVGKGTSVRLEFPSKAEQPTRELPQHTMRIVK